ncbi:MAG: zinc finger domain-containing protein [Nanoarchaeota archaeon]
MKESLCSSCRTRITNIKGSAIFKCPSCGEEEIIRCGHCRVIVAKYKCSKCGFIGPN